jgi:hypothetical protein
LSLGSPEKYVSGCAGLSTVTYREGAQGRSLELLTYFRKNKDLVAKERENAAATSVLCLVWLLGGIHGMEKWVSVSQTLYPYRHFAQSALDPVCFIPTFPSFVHILPFFLIVQSSVCPICIFFFYVAQQLKSGLSGLIVDVYSQHTIGHKHTHTHTHTHTH